MNNSAFLCKDDTSNDKALSRVQRYLIKRWSECSSWTTPLPWYQDYKFHLSELYTSLQMVITNSKGDLLSKQEMHLEIILKPLTVSTYLMLKVNHQTCRPTC